MPKLNRGDIVIATRPFETHHTTIEAGERMLVDDVDEETGLAELTILDRQHFPQGCGHNSISLAIDFPDVAPLHQPPRRSSFGQLMTLAAAVVCIVALTAHDGTRPSSHALASPAACVPTSAPSPIE